MQDVCQATGVVSHSDPTRPLCPGDSPEVKGDGCMFLSKAPQVALGQDSSGLGELGALGAQEAA